MMLNLSTLLATVLSWFSPQERRIRQARCISDYEMLSRLTLPERTVLHASRYIARELGFTSVKQMKFFDHVLSTFLYASNPSGIEKRVVDIVLDPNSSHKKLTNAILAYEVYKGGYALNDIRKLTQLANYAGYKRPINLEQQVERLLTQLLKGGGE